MVRHAYCIALPSNVASMFADTGFYSATGHANIPQATRTRNEVYDINRVTIRVLAYFPDSSWFQIKNLVSLCQVTHTTITTWVMSGYLWEPPCIVNGVDLFGLLLRSCVY